MAMILRAMPSTCREVDSPSGTAPSWRERRRRRRRRKTQGRHSTDVSLPPLHPILLRVRVPRRGHGTSSARDATNPALGQQKRPKRAEWGAKKKMEEEAEAAGTIREKNTNTHTSIDVRKLNGPTEERAGGRKLSRFFFVAHEAAEHRRKN